MGRRASNALGHAVQIRARRRVAMNQRLYPYLLQAGGYEQLPQPAARPPIRVALVAVKLHDAARQGAVRMVNNPSVAVLV